MLDLSYIIYATLSLFAASLLIDAASSVASARRGIRARSDEAKK